jgi:hypothetical protein
MLRGKIRDEVIPVIFHGVTLSVPNLPQILNFPGGLQIPPLRFAPVGMTRGEGWPTLEVAIWMGRRFSNFPEGPLRCAPVGMTILF